jgi:hypothetical protein
MTRPTINTHQDQLIWAYARIAYDHYGQSTHWRTHNGGIMPPWETLGDRQKRAWYDAARAIRITILNRSGMDTQ